VGFEKPHSSPQPHHRLDRWWVVQLPGRRRWPKNLSSTPRYSSPSAYSSFNLQNKLSSFLIRQLYGPYVVRANVLRLRLVLRAFFGHTVRTTPEIDPYVPHDSFNRTVLRPVENAAGVSSSPQSSLICSMIRCKISRVEMPRIPPPSFEL
jgi:hypothetical protein